MHAEHIAKDNALYVTLAGSWAYGLNIETSDRDERGVFAPRPENLIGLPSHVVQHWRDDASDTQYLFLGQFLHHCAEGAPNWVEMLFVPEEHVLFESPLMLPIFENRDLFLTRTLGKKSVGFIRGMYKRAIEGLAKQNSGWDEPQIRKGLLHGIRVGRMLSEVMDTGAPLRVDRSFERDDLLAIRRGTRSIESACEECLAGANALEAKAAVADLPEVCDLDTVNELAMWAMLHYWKEMGWIN